MHDKLIFETMTVPIYNFISPCCRAFNYFDGNEIHCSCCKRVIAIIKNNESVTIMSKYNTNAISDDVVKEFEENASRYAHDHSCQSIEKQCPKCKNKRSKYLRNPRGEIIYICEACRNVFKD